MLEITPTIALDESELTEEFVRATGPGGQNVNKVATAVQLRFDAAHSPSLPDDVRARLTRLAGQRMTEDGMLLIIAKRYRTQVQNRADAREQLSELIRKATIRPKLRRKTKPTFASQQQRIESKQRRGAIKRTRRSTSQDE
jgi:ribosome-associated protein